MENPNYEQIVSDAAKWLDGVEPGWHKKIDRKRLDISSCTACIIGQLFGDFSEGLARLGVIHTPKDRWKQREPWALAFTRDPDVAVNTGNTQLWLAEIDARLEADKAKSADAFIAKTNEIINQPVEEAEYERADY